MGLPRERRAVDPAALCRDRRRAVRRGATAGEGRALTYRPPGWQRVAFAATGTLTLAACPTPNSCSSCWPRSDEHTSELQSLMRTSYAVFCLKKKKRTTKNIVIHLS